MVNNYRHMYLLVYKLNLINAECMSLSSLYMSHHRLRMT